MCSPLTSLDVLGRPEGVDLQGLTTFLKMFICSVTITLFIILYPVQTNGKMSDPIVNLKNKLMQKWTRLDKVTFWTINTKVNVPILLQILIYVTNNCINILSTASDI